MTHTQLQPPPPPLSRGIVKGIGFWFLSPYPRWMWDGYYILDDVSISTDGVEHFPKKLTAKQHITLAEARRVIAYYEGLR